MLVLSCNSYSKYGFLEEEESFIIGSEVREELEDFAIQHFKDNNLDYIESTKDYAEEAKEHNLETFDGIMNFQSVIRNWDHGWSRLFIYDISELEMISDE